METQEFYISYDEELQQKQNQANVSYTYNVLKRFFDILLSVIGLIILSPVFLIISIIIKLTSPGPVLYKHKRVGYMGEEIEIYKFRSMVVDSDNFEKYFTKEQMKHFKENFKLENDPRITKIGKFLRKSSLDELPQLINIIKGQMSIVGPRPIVKDEVKKYGIYADTYFSVKPGLTGLWQVCGRSNTTYEERVQLDVKYVQNRSLLNDLKIILKTFGAVVTSKGAC
ncbi:bacterial sugar transferase family protein [[Clostridium] cellulosi]|uniref:Bacterial sugar transferase family protein n=1 Tax=[Clostridium] cellulosi TaxID=29343 RepID=A0A078KMB2_9FIRM|nr:bacterial sugar transferase family protein [[Clostridium] cellulosi]